MLPFTGSVGKLVFVLTSNKVAPTTNSPLASPVNNAENPVTEIEEVPLLVIITAIPTIFLGNPNGSTVHNSADNSKIAVILILTKISMDANGKEVIRFELIIAATVLPLVLRTITPSGFQDVNN